MSKGYDPINWYWIVNGSTAQVYSSAEGAFVGINDAAYLAWSADGTRPTRIASEAELGEVLSAYSIRPAAAGVLDGYRDIQSRKLTVEVVAKVLLWCVNEIRTLKGQQPISAAGFRTFVKGLL